MGSKLSCLMIIHNKRNSIIINSIIDLQTDIMTIAHNQIIVSIDGIVTLSIIITATEPMSFSNMKDNDINTFKTSSSIHFKRHIPVTIIPKWVSLQIQAKLNTPLTQNSTAPQVPLPYLYPRPASY